MGLLYAKDGKLYSSESLDIYIPLEYDPISQGITVSTFGILFIQSTANNTMGDMKMLMIPTTIELNVYDTEKMDITIHGRKIKCMVCHYAKDLAVLPQFSVKSREKAEAFLRLVINGKLPSVLDYASLADIWWRNLGITGVSFKIPAKIYEIIFATVYRDGKNMKRRYGEVYGKQPVPNGFGYATDNIRDIVASLSSFSGFIYEDNGKMITSGVNNAMEGIDEPVSPLEKIITY